MLSLGKLTPGRASYYSDQLPGGADEYYTGGRQEATAVWLGSGAVHLGLTGAVTPEQFARLLDAAHPATGEPLGVPRTTNHRLAGFDLCFSAPKSVSLSWALAPPHVADAVAAAHDRAVAETMAVFETEVARGRRGKRAANLVDSHGVAAAAFGHRTSRAGDPQIHTHVVVANLTLDAAGRWSALAGDRVYRYAKTLGYLYQAALRAELTRSFGVTWGPVRNGMADIAGIDPAVLAEFSTRRAQIAAALDAVGASSRSAAEVAALTTRPAKDTQLDLGALRVGWAERARRAGVERPPLCQLTPEPVGSGRIASGGADPDLDDRLVSPEGLTANRSSFDRRDILQAVAAEHHQGLHPRQAIAAADRITARPDVVALASDRPAGRRYSTTELLGVEADLTARAAARRHGPVAQVSLGQLQAALDDRPTLSAEQRAMVTSLTRSGAAVEIVVGRAGSGKTFALDAARAAWTAAGHPVLGAALAARAAAELQAGAAIPSGTVDRLLAELDQPGPLSPLPPGSVVVVDEAAMVGTRKLARLAAHAERARSKLVLVGDPRQLPEIEAGGAFAALARGVPVSELADNRRQAHEWERRALAELRAGSVPAALTAFRDSGRVHLAATADGARHQMVDDWWDARQAGQAATMYALRRADVEDLNARARRTLDAAGRLGPERVEAAGRDFAIGDEVLCLRNDRRLGVRNGTRSTVAGLDPLRRTVTLADGTVLPPEYLDAGRLGYAYATTVHKAQGATVDRAFLLGSDTLYREAGYVGLSRARHGSDLYIVADLAAGIDGGDPLAATIRRLSESRAQTLASEQLETGQLDAGQLETGPLRWRPAVRPALTGSRPDMPAERAALVADPPAWVIETLGPAPATPDQRERWARSAERIAAYRDIHQIHDLSDPLGPRPDPPEQRRAWDLAQLAIDDYQRTLNLDRGHDKGMER